jgi:hypothetical protein
VILLPGGPRVKGLLQRLSHYLAVLPTFDHNI